jgi:hypothetical protein
MPRPFGHMPNVDPWLTREDDDFGDPIVDDPDDLDDEDLEPDEDDDLDDDEEDDDEEDA